MVDILAIGAHPDDVEFSVGGILAKGTANGKSVVIVDATLGEKGSHGTPEGRKEEALAAAKVIGAEREFLEFKDCEITDTYEGRLEIVKAIRRHKPRLVLAPLWKGEMNHPDHLALGVMCRYACRYARFKNILPELPIHTVQGILHYPQAAHFEADFICDISDHVDLWKEMINCHKSQLQTRPYLEWCLKAAAHNGMRIGVDYAQTLVKGNPIQVDCPLSVARGALEL